LFLSGSIQRSDHVRPTVEEEEKMILVTGKARDKLVESLKEQGENPAIRVYIAGSG
jgi:hypothetical protein